MKKPKRILIGLKLLDHAAELTDIGCRLGARGASLLLVHVIELPDPTQLNADVPELEAKAEKILRTAERVARRSQMKVSRLILRAHDAGPALLDEMKERNIEMAVISQHHQSKLGEMLLGSTGQRLARNAPCHLLVHIPPRA